MITLQELPSLLQAARELQIIGLGEEKQEIIPVEQRNGHHGAPLKMEEPKENGLPESLTGAPQESVARPSSGASNSSGQSGQSQKTGSSRKKGNPKRLIVNSHTPPESPSPDSLYAQSNESPGKNFRDVIIFF